MDDQLSMCRAYYNAQFGDEPYATLLREIACTTPLVDRDTFDVLHCQIWHAVAADTSIDQPCNAGVFEASENFSLAAKTAVFNGVVNSPTQKFYRDRLMKIRAASMGEENSALTSLPDQPYQAKRTELSPLEGAWIELVIGSRGNFQETIAYGLIKIPRLSVDAKHLQQFFPLIGIDNVFVKPGFGRDLGQADAVIEPVTEL
jgi:hypothetical protein